MFDRILADLKGHFGMKVLLSPEDIAEIINCSTGSQANKRSAGTFPIPYDKGSLGKVVINIYDLANYLANVGKSEVRTQISNTPDYPKLTRTQKKSTKGRLQNDWFLTYCPQVVSIINRSLLDSQLAKNPAPKQPVSRKI